jgi:hypothetical protein
MFLLCSEHTVAWELVMAGIVWNWRVELIEAYPDLFRPPAGAPEGAEGSPECGEGWRDLLDRACVRIRRAVHADGGSFRFTQIKEKYGTARLYWGGSLSPGSDGLGRGSDRAGRGAFGLYLRALR